MKLLYQLLKTISENINRQTLKNRLCYSIDRLIIPSPRQRAIRALSRAIHDAYIIFHDIEKDLTKRIQKHTKNYQMSVQDIIEFDRLASDKSLIEQAIAEYGSKLIS